MARTLAEAKEYYENACKKRDAKKKTKGKSTYTASGSSSVSPGATGSSEYVIRARPGMRALREIRSYQESTELLFAKVPFQKLVRQIVKQLGPYRFEVQALVALQEAAENYLVGLFEDASLMTLHANRVTVMLRDLKLAHRMRSDKKTAGMEAATTASKTRVKVEQPPEVTATGADVTVPVDAEKRETQSVAVPPIDAAPTAADMDDDDDEENDPDYADSDEDVEAKAETGDDATMAEEDDICEADDK
mmetsp:Transcript_4306/g.10609  ORF Transcript_4306/g.10609 Transcript_4306/m.10609 type:complete len:248 (+) Transcript_4306:60-803(+)